ncbi:hypothetical protein HPB48_014662 [Haemaphysalis longicornis]|uniref:Uncharacterized protein n=1 Tax=Haemaphysalis longicornis TaxID=44386 RepID=A0A9J6G8A1_HAELO|nr:hypothetical protein HPB48_014662 [Haemaphysalis longicornis]
MGPKFCLNPNLDRTELLSIVRTTASKVKEESASRWIQEAAEALPNTHKKGYSGVLKSTAALLREADLRLLPSDKEGGFVLASSDVYTKKVDKGIAGIFKPVTDANPGKIKSRAIKLCEEAGLTKMAASVRKTERTPSQSSLQKLTKTNAPSESSCAKEGHGNAT